MYTHHELYCREATRTTPFRFSARGIVCTRVREANEHDWKKLGHEVKYLQGTKHLPLILRSDGKGTANWIDGAHAVHHDMKGHVGMYASEGQGH
jgi:hypothetical protein